MRSIIFVTALIILILTGCTQVEQKKSSGDEIVNVNVQPVTYLEYQLPIRLSGMLATGKEMKLGFKTGGLIQEIPVTEGGSVKKDQVLAQLDLSEISAQYNQAEIGIDKARRDLRRAENLFRDSVTTLEQYQNAKSVYELAKSQKQIAEFNLKHSRIRAPSDGKIQKILVESNEIIAPGHPAIVFASTESAWIIRVSLTDKDIVKLSLGDSATISMDAFPNRLFYAEIAELGAIADPVTGTYESELLILNPMPQFRTGYIARVKIFPAEVIQSLIIPIEAVLDAQDNTAYVYTLNGDKLIKKRIKIGMIHEKGMVILEGLVLDDTVITEGATYLGKKSQVRIVNDQNSSDQ